MHNPKLATEMDSCRSTALHMAAAEGHVHIVKELLQVFDEICLPEEHLIRLLVQRVTKELSNTLVGLAEFTVGLNTRIEELLKLLDMKSNGVRVLGWFGMGGVGKTTLAKALLIESSWILSIATSFQVLEKLHPKMETVRYLLLIPKIREAAKLDQSEMSLTDNMENSKSFQSQVSLLKSCPRSNEKIPTENHRPSPSAIFTPPKKCDWLEEMRGNLSLVATVISTISFQALINPPGGFIIQVSAISYPCYFHYYLKYNTVAFVSSLAVALLLVSGVPLKHKAVIWMLSSGMCITLTFLTLTYFNGLKLVTPDGELFDSAYDISKVSLWTWIGFLGLIALFITFRFLFWLWKNWMKTFKCQILPCT
ncbi:hypothetical protein K1719_009198 [Acacia pycnantha]|nr:hypothetical protein K1719_009198 [Acacia pycnantha]